MSHGPIALRHRPQVPLDPISIHPGRNWPEKLAPFLLALDTLLQRASKSTARTG